ncbi:MAG: protein-tyrosine-phosphatase [Polyangiales bacterium]
MHPKLDQYIKRALRQLDGVSPPRGDLLEKVADFVSEERSLGRIAALNFICTHNSRRSQMGQLWAIAAAAHFGLDGVRVFSGGTEVTAFNPRAVAAIARAGFSLWSPGGHNPHYRATIEEDGPGFECFSKKYDDPFNQAQGFAAIMTCSEADEACPVVLGATLRIPLRYEDPKVADGTPDEAAVYDERCMQIATEMLYVFSRVR